MDIGYFNKHLKPLIHHFAFEYSSFMEGDFGDLERVEFKGCGLLGTVDFWSRGWVAIDLYDDVAHVQRMNRLLSPEEDPHPVFSELAERLCNVRSRHTSLGNP